MDALGATASILGVVDILTRSLLKLRELQQKLKDADLTLVTLIGELTATKAALKQLHNCVVEHAHIEQHYDLIMDFEASLAACQLLVNVIDAKLSAFDFTRPTSTLLNKLRAIITDGEMTDYLGRLGRTLSALNIVKEGFLR